MIADDLTDATHIQVISDSGHDKGTSGIKMIKSLFMKGEEPEKDNPLNVYKDDISRGKIVILLDEK